VLESVVLAICEREGRGTRLIRSVAEQKDEIAEARRLLDLLRLGRDINMPTRHLPYGKQRLLEIALALATRPKVLLLDDPTRGVDVGAKAELYRLMAQLCREGLGIIVTSSELPELLTLSDRISVLCEGRLTGHFTRAEATEQRIMEAATARKQSVTLPLGGLCPPIRASEK
jgi:ribose transport system ATP-binding protein